MAAMAFDEPDGINDLPVLLIELTSTASLRGIISSLYMLMVQAHDFQGSATQHAMTAETKQLISQLLQLSQNATSVMVPIDLIEFVENARNPDIYTRQFVEEAMRLNQELKGKSQALQQFTSILGREMMSAVPEIQTETSTILKASNIEAA